ncbi:YitT family protein [Spirosoma montaniterrae]|uniref:DUF2179 domain-containing protein n=1 Tax=Spirosoma montaniterrae TaxID=1178516 RepID=A0A1P9X2W4_9BACT|nr:YitT family protein [Spirosoma montaniterrae]AQG81980.1 hypothetical protein AWR27_23390 [Spirosoma montaniterrae]
MIQEHTDITTQTRPSIGQHIKDACLIVLGIFSAAFGFEGFLLTNDFIDGGATGISLLIAALTDIPLPYLLICVNIPFIALGYKILGKQFAVKASLAIAGLAICLTVVEFPDITQDNLLVAIFGGFFLGVGIGLSMRGGAVIDGTEILAIYLSRMFGTSIGTVIIVINVLIFSVAAFMLGIEIALYSMITYLAASKTLNFIVEGIEEYVGVTIVASRSDEIRQMISNQLGHGVTLYTGKRPDESGKTQGIDILYTVVTQLELMKLNAEIEKIEPDAFVVMSNVRDAKGGVVKKRPLH